MARSSLMRVWGQVVAGSDRVQPNMTSKYNTSLCRRHRMKVLKYALPALAIAGSTSFIAPTAQSAEISGNVALVSDYKFRGISQSDSKPSIPVFMLPIKFF